jgi:hypothetical protein
VVCLALQTKRATLFLLFLLLLLRKSFNNGRPAFIINASYIFLSLSLSLLLKRERAIKERSHRSIVFLPFVEVRIESKERKKDVVASVASKRVQNRSGETKVGTAETAERNEREEAVGRHRRRRRRRERVR